MVLQTRKTKRTNLLQEKSRLISGDWGLGRRGRQIELDSVGLRVTNFSSYEGKGGRAPRRLGVPQSCSVSWGLKRVNLLCLLRPRMPWCYFSSLFHPCTLGISSWRTIAKPRGDGVFYQPQANPSCLCCQRRDWTINTRTKKNYSRRWITRLVCRWRAQPAAWINVNCRTHWTSISWTHIAAWGHSRSHACLRVGETFIAKLFFCALGRRSKQICSVLFAFASSP